MRRKYSEYRKKHHDEILASRKSEQAHRYQHEYHKKWYAQHKGDNSSIIKK